MLIPAFEKNHFRKDPFFLNALPRVCVVDVTFPSKPAGECTNFTTAIVCDVQVFLVEQGNTKKKGNRFEVPAEQYEKFRTDIN